jgi:uncharacterized DUF497 family protein
MKPFIRFVWDDTKEKENIRKHRISFSEASTVFLNFPFEVFFDPDHSETEDRFIAIGVSKKQRILLVVHCENSTGTEIRIISARKATRKERNSSFGGRI